MDSGKDWRMVTVAVDCGVSTAEVSAQRWMKWEHVCEWLVGKDLEGGDLV